MDIKNVGNEIIKKILKPWIPHNLITEEISGLYGNALLAEMGEIIKYYNIYNYGADFYNGSENLDYIPSNLHYKKIKALIDKEARFMFANSPDININTVNVSDTEQAKVSTYQKYVNEVLKKNHFNANLIKAARDCFIGKRIAIICNFNSEYGISISFVPSLEFVYESDAYNKITKIIAFFAINDEINSNDQRIQKKKYWMENGFCHVSEGIYDGTGNLIESLIEDETTKFPYIPAVVIINDGLTGDSLGESEVANLFDYEQTFSKISNQDIDAQKRGMNPIYWSKDMSQTSTANLSIAPGAFWDLATDVNSADGLTGEVGVLEANLNYSEAMDNTLNRIRDSMYEQIDMPAVSSSDLQGVVSSGKTLKAIYWGLIVRCDEKMKSWKYELEYIVKCIIDGAFYYPEITYLYLPSNEKLEQVDYTIDIENSYPLPEDENEEKQIDLAEIGNKTRSIRSYLMKWRNLTQEDADKEIMQIAKERQILEDSFFYTNPNPNNNSNNA